MPILSGRLAALLAAASIAIGGAPAAPAEGASPSPLFAPVDDAAPIRVETERIDATGLADLVVQSNVDGAVVSINRVEAGYIPFAKRSLPVGNYVIGVSAAGYRSRELSILLAERTKYTIRFPLSRLMGLLSVTAEPADAELIVDEVVEPPGTYALPAGTRVIRVRRFGYVEQRVKTTILDGSTTAIEARLTKAPFGVAGLAPDRASFNPRNAGSLGRVRIGFSATGPGSARLELLAPDGTAVFARDFPALGWEQAATWDGRGPDGSPLPDGAYRVSLRALPDPGWNPTGPAVGGAGGGVGVPAKDGGSAVGLETTIRLDSSLRIGPLGAAAATPGLLLFPEPAIGSFGLDSTSLEWVMEASGPARSAFCLGSSLNAAGVAVISLAASAETGSSASGEAGLFASGMIPLLGRGGLVAPAVEPAGSRLAVSAFIRGSWASDSSPLLPSSNPGLEAALPASVAVGPLSFGIAPALFLDLSGSAPRARALGRIGLWASGPTWRVGLSGAAVAASSPSPAAPARQVSAAFEVHLLVPPNPLVASARAVVDLEPGSAAVWLLGLGLGFLL